MAFLRTLVRSVAFAVLGAGWLQAQTTHARLVVAPQGRPRIAEIAPPPPPLGLRRLCGGGQRESRNTERRGDLRPHAAEGVGQDHGHSGHATNEEGSYLRESVSRHGLTFVSPCIAKTGKCTVRLEPGQSALHATRRERPDQLKTQSRNKSSDVPARLLRPRHQCV